MAGIKEVNPYSVTHDPCPCKSCRRFPHVARCAYEDVQWRWLMREGTTSMLPATLEMIPDKSRDLSVVPRARDPLEYSGIHARGFGALGRRKIKAA